MVSGKRQCCFSNVFSGAVRTQSKKVEISTADISKTRQLTPKLSRLIKKTSAGKRKICTFDFGVNSSYPEATVNHRPYVRRLSRSP